ncbi:unnamed protein product [Calypogeia fissa]
MTSSRGTQRDKTRRRSSSSSSMRSKPTQPAPTTLVVEDEVLCFPAYRIAGLKSTVYEDMVVLYFEGIITLPRARSWVAAYNLIAITRIEIHDALINSLYVARVLTSEPLLEVIALLATFPIEVLG